MDTILNALTAFFTLIIAIFTYNISRKTFKQEHTVNLQINACVNTPPYDLIKVELKNFGNQTFTIKSISIGVGVSAIKQKTLFQKEINKKVKLNYGDSQTYLIKQIDIQKGYQKLRIKQEYNQLLWVNITSSLNQTISNEINISHKIINKKPSNDIAEPFIATDTFLGLPQMDSYIPSSFIPNKCVHL